MKQELEIYIHIPFCVKKCNYCDFLSFPCSSEVHDVYVKKLMEELIYRSVWCREYSVSSVFIGGGTPSSIHERYIADILETLNKYYYTRPDMEITIECNPASVMRHKFSTYKKAGVNRLSIGLQSADNAELKMLGRIHSFEEFLKAYQSARMEGFDNINVDLIDCIPMQSLKTWKKTLRNVLMLKPEHVSVYNLIVEEGTPFYEMQQKGLLLMPSEEEQSAIDLFTKECMDKYGYKRYEFSNYSRPGRECRHNKGYWTGVPYIGFGIGAASSFAGVRWNNIRDIQKYLALNLKNTDGPDPDFKSVAEPVDEADSVLRTDIQKLSRTDRMEEYMYLGMRLTEGVSAEDFRREFGAGIEEIFGEPLKKHAASGLIIKDGERYRLSDRGIDLSNIVLSDFLLH